ncbi:hypothetical protein BC936DRAFT_142691 [Jimgerdemannia flammicorona]|uniref:Nudix hydrolase domain-containing protein n=1 Tax=Jimgerdemannia flammicorona TaxID=994334 RepID=A0A432ZZZ0_9FUNG|nr:hypothetical protein BC936DRAFT_142691 [Jimgerdemannia flammicorona]
MALVHGSFQEVILNSVKHSKSVPRVSIANLTTFWYNMTIHLNSLINPETNKGEVLEETNLRIDHISFCSATNDIMTDEGKHYVTVFVQAKVIGDEGARLQVMEPNKCEGWEWATWEEIRDDNSKYRPLFSPLRNFIINRKEAWPTPN